MIELRVLVGELLTRLPGVVKAYSAIVTPAVPRSSRRIRVIRSLSGAIQSTCGKPPERFSSMPVCQYAS